MTYFHARIIDADFDAVLARTREALKTGSGS